MNKKKNGRNILIGLAVALALAAGVASFLLSSCEEAYESMRSCLVETGASEEELAAFDENRPQWLEVCGSFWIEMNECMYWRHERLRSDCENFCHCMGHRTALTTCHVPHQ